MTRVRHHAHASPAKTSSAGGEQAFALHRDRIQRGGFGASLRAEATQEADAELASALLSARIDPRRKMTLVLSGPPSLVRSARAPACPMRPARAAGRLRSFSGILAPVADDEHAQLFVDREPALGAGLDVNGGAFGNRHRFTLDLEHARALENDVH